MSRPDRGVDLPVALAVWLGLSLSAAALAPLLRGLAWWWMCVAIIGLVLAAGQLGRAFAVPVLIRAPLAAALWLALVCAAFAPAASWAGIVPTPTTVSVLGELLLRARQTVVNEAAPVAVDAPIALLLVLAMTASALMADATALRMRAPLATGAVYLTLVAVPGIVLGERPPIPVIVGIAVAWLVLLRQTSGPGRGETGRRRAVVSGLAAIVVMVALTPALPTPQFRDLAASESSEVLFGHGANPMIELGRDLRRSRPYRALSYTAGEPRYLTLAHLTVFDGRRWAPDPMPEGADPVDARSGPTEADGPAAWVRDDYLAPEPDVTRIRIDRLASPRLPVPYPATRIAGLEGSWVWEPQGPTVSTRTASTRGQSYTVTSARLEVTADQLRSLGRGRAEDRLHGLPRAMPDSIRRTAREVAAGARSDYDRALALQSFLRDGDFSYSEAAPVEQDYDGSGVEVIEAFLSERAGYCVHFASTMAVMARSLGIASRIAVGYLPGTPLRRGADGETVYAVSSDELHAWPELYFAGVGWIRFEPTPGRGQATGLDEPSDPAVPRPPVVPDRDRDREEAEAADPLPGADDSRAGDALGSSGWAPLAWPAMLALLLVAPAAWRWTRRRRRLASRSANPGWAELIDTARDLGLEADHDDSPRRTATRLAQQMDVRREVERLCELVERERYAPAQRQGADAGSAAGQAVRALIAGAPAAKRWRARIIPRSLLRR